MSPAPRLPPFLDCARDCPALVRSRFRCPRASWEPCLPTHAPSPGCGSALDFPLEDPVNRTSLTSGGSGSLVLWSSKSPSTRPRGSNKLVYDGVPPVSGWRRTGLPHTRQTDPFGSRFGSQAFPRPIDPAAGDNRGVRQRDGGPVAEEPTFVEESSCCSTPVSCSEKGENLFWSFTN